MNDHDTSGGFDTAADGAPPGTDTSPGDADGRDETSTPGRNERTRLADGEADDLEIAQPEDFEVRRDADGEIIPVKQRIPGTDKAVLVRPMPPGAFEANLDVLEGTTEDSARQAGVLSEWIVEGPGAEADAEYVEQSLRGGALPGLLAAIRNAAGYEVLLADFRQRMGENAAIADRMGVEIEELLHSEMQAQLGDELQ